MEFNIHNKTCITLGWQGSRAHIFPWWWWSWRNCKITISMFWYCTSSSSSLSACLRDVLPSVDLSVRPIMAVFPWVTVATLPLHFRHHLVSHLIPWPPVCAVAVDKTEICHTSPSVCSNVVMHGLGTYLFTHMVLWKPVTAVHLTGQSVLNIKCPKRQIILAHNPLKSLIKEENSLTGAPLNYPVTLSLERASFKGVYINNPWATIWYL